MRIVLNMAFGLFQWEGTKCIKPVFYGVPGGGNHGTADVDIAGEVESLEVDTDALIDPRSKQAISEAIDLALSPEGAPGRGGKAGPQQQLQGCAPACVYMRYIRQ